MTDDTTYIGLDVHKSIISVAVTESDLRGEGRYVGTITNNKAALTKLAAKLAAAGFGYVLYSEVPDLWTWIGSVVILIAGMVLSREEQTPAQT